MDGDRAQEKDLLLPLCFSTYFCFLSAVVPGMLFQICSTSSLPLS